MKVNYFALLLLAVIIASPLIGQDNKKLIRVPLYKTLDTISHNSERFYLEKSIPSLQGIPQDLDTFLIFSYSFSNQQRVYEDYKLGLIPEKRFKSSNIDPKTITDHPVKHKLYALSGLRGEKKIVIADTNNNGSLADETIMEFSAAVSEEIIFAKDNWSDLMLVHTEHFHNGRIMSRQVVGKIDPYIKLVNPPSELQEKLLLSFKEFEYRKGTFFVDGENYLITSHRSGNLFKLISLDKPKQVAYPTIQLGQSIHIGQSIITFEEVDPEKNELLLIKIHEDEIKASEYGGLVGMKAPNIQGQNLVGKRFDLKNKQGSYVMLEFWGSWCGPCKADHPELRSWNDRFEKRNISLVGIAMDSNADRVSNYTKEASLEWEQVYFKLYGEEFKRITNEYYVTGYPTYFLIDPQGIIMARGGLEDLEGDLEKLLREK